MIGFKVVGIGDIRRFLFALGVVTGLVWVVAAVLSSDTVGAQTNAGECRAALIIDRSGSVSEGDMAALKHQISELFDTSRIQNENYYLAFWTFASAAGSERSGNYNDPFTPYVPITGNLLPAQFNNDFDRIFDRRSGATNYEQGFAYDRGQQNPNQAVRNIANSADVFVFLTDGVPNTPGNGDNNATAVRVAREAVEKYKQANKDLTIVGGLIGAGLDRRSLQEVVTGNPNMAAVNGPSDNPQISSNQYEVIPVPSYAAADELQAVLSKIAEKCSAKVPPDPAAAYSLEPMVVTDSRIVAGSGNVTFNYSVHNTNNENASRMTNWTVKRLLVGREQSVAALTSGFSNGDGRPYRDGYSCAQLMSLISNNGSCVDAADGQRVFTPGSNDMSFDVGSVREATIDDSWEAGTKLCYVLTITVPTNLNNPRDRFSRAACTTIGKLPSVQVHGGDIWVGRKMAGDTTEVSTEALPPVNIRTSVVTKSDGSSYGSWAEYGVFAAGTITGFASKSGLADPVLGLADWNKLTFANTDTELGKYVDPESVQNTMPNVAAAIVGKYEDSKDLSGAEELTISDLSQNGLYQKPNGNLVLRASEVSKGRSIVVHVPAGKVTIAGDIRYDNGDDEAYTSITQIPQLVIVAQSIDIQSDVLQVDAWLIANGEESGVIRTCDTPGPLTSQICQRPLQINGPVMARELQLRRTAGAGIGGAAGDPAEVINLRADVYLWSQSEGRSGVRAQTTHTIEMPPYF